MVSVDEIKSAYLKKANNDKGKVLKRLAEQFNMSPRSFNNRINGNVRFKEDELNFLSKILNIDTEV